MADDVTLDLTGMRCPLPIVRINNACRSLPAGGHLSFLADDPAFPLDIQAWARRTGHVLQLQPADDGLHRGRVTRAS
jgi:tRNA 2-thiouridine synthesizing protein A